MKFNILYLFSKPRHCDYIADYLLYGLRENDYFVIDFPKRLPLYTDSFNKVIHAYQDTIHTAICGKDPIKNREDINLKELDLIIAENAGIFTGYFEFWRKWKKKRFLKKIKRLDIPIVCLLTADSYTVGSPLPHIRLDSKNFKMAIREKSLQPENINIEKNDFPLFFTTPKKYCKFTPLEEKSEDIFFSMTINNEVRKKFNEYFENKYIYENIEDYFNAIRKTKFGISIFGVGYLCKRDPEIGGNTLLCRMRKQGWISPSIDYKDGKSCIEFSNLKELNIKMEYYNSNPNEYSKLLENCYKHTLKYFTSESQARRLVKWTLE